MQPQAPVFFHINTSAMTMKLTSIPLSSRPQRCIPAFLPSKRAQLMAMNAPTCLCLSNFAPHSHINYGSPNYTTPFSSSVLILKRKTPMPQSTFLNHPKIPAATRFTGATFSPPTSWKLNVTFNSEGGLLKDESRAIELPCLPFTTSEVFLPSATTTLHLYEARFLALLEEAMEKHNNFFVHFVLDPVSDFGSSAMASFAASYGCLTLIENVKRIEIGALVTIRGIGHVNIVTLTQTEPYLRGIVEPKQDEMPKDSSSVNAAVEELKLAVADLHRLQLKLKTSKDEQLQTPLWNSLRWAEKDGFLDCNKVFLPRLAERISFAALQPLTGATASELRVLLQERLRAMESTSTIQRLYNVTKLVKESRALIAAKLALQSLNL